MIKFASQLFVTVILLLSSTLTLAKDIDTQNPYKLINDLGEQVFQAVSEAKKANANDPQQMAKLVDELMMPYIDVPFASYKILGAQLKKTTKDERKNFVSAMKQDLIKTYSSALAQYNNQTITYEPSKDVGKKKSVAVRTVLVSPDAPEIDMIFKLRKNKKTGQWKAYDLVVEGISLIDSKRAELAKPLRDKGVSYVTDLISKS
jgi:phospholipid transport system substrate-binding protein